jgi:hypothetical protein
MLLRVVDDGTFRDIAIKEGEMFLLPGALRCAKALTATVDTCGYKFPYFHLFGVSRTRTHPTDRHGTRNLIAERRFMRYRSVPCATTGNTPHNPVRFADTVGIVIERVRPEASIGMWPVA